MISTKTYQAIEATKMHKTMRLIGNILLVAIPIIFSTANVHAVPSSTDYTLKPPVLVSSETPLVMLGLSVDHQLFYKVYSDYSDVTGDGILDTDYTDSFDYFGYFDSDWCYEYDEADDVFGPSSSAVGLALTPKTHTCAGTNEWSGNLLNWATMTRMDVLRGVLYGGKRTSAVTVTGAGAVLERAYVPNDNHAFAKVIKTNVADFTPFSSPFSICNFSTSNANPPIFRIADGQYRRWSADESIQCRFNQSNAPTLSTEGRKPDGSTTSTEAEAQATVRVARCVSGKDENSTACRQYTDSSGTTYKRPTGLLQEYGENGDLRFGLISGSYEKKISGGALRKTISLITDEINVETGVFTGAAGIIDTIDDIQITGWSGSRYNDCSTHSIPISTFKSSSSAANRKCSNWGNPVAEIYLEAMRYFAGETTAAFAVSSSDALGASVAWPSAAANPLNTNNFCADCSIIMLSSGANSFDSDDDDLNHASGMPGLTGNASVRAVTDAVAVLEGITGSYVISDVTGSSNTDEGYCTSKTLGVGSFSKVLGICPEVPKMEGGYNVAGLAYHAKTTDMRTATAMEEEQTINTFAVELSEALPKFSVGTSSNFINFTPACESKSGSNPWLPCSLFDVEVLEFEPEVDGTGAITGIKKARFIFHWEDSSWGNDYDVDISQIVWVCAGAYCDNADTNSIATYDNTVSSNQVRITNGIAYLNAGNNLNVSYSVNGSTTDGLESDWLGKTGGQTTFWDGASSAGYPGIHPPESHVYTYGSSTTKNLERPLWYAAKYGGFTETSDGNDDPTDDEPDVQSEWDSTNNLTGAAGADGVPDNYFLASNPSLLRTQLQRVFDGLVARTASGTNAAVVSNSSSGVGAIYQALYQPLVRAGSSSASWVGTLQAIFIDSNGYFREDTDGDALLDSYTEDPIITLSFNESLKKTELQRWHYDSVNKIKGGTNGAAVDISELKPMWSTVQSLACFPNASAKTQRAYATLTHNSGCTTGGRHILTWLESVTPASRDGEIDSGETVSFLPSEFSTNNLHRWLDVPDTASATLLIDYIRGFDDSSTTGLRNRTLDKDINGDGDIDDDDVWRLGDIIHSTPAVVASPNGAYDTTHSDDTYKTFFTQYQTRRQMIYVGGNDGMLHGINGGFWDPLTSEFSTAGKKHDDSAAVEHPLGSEVWAYVPQNLLPHLKWLAEPNYPHVYFVDGAPFVFDANVFNSDTDHPGGWGTVMVVGMNFGGGDYPLDLDGDGIYGDATTRSSYVIFDITNPEVAPKVLAEVQSSDLGYTTSMPTLVKSRVPTVNITAGTEDWSSPASNEWYLVFGTGPHGSNAISEGKSDQTAKVKMLNLKTLGKTGAIAVTDISTGDSLSSVGNLHTVDWDRDLVDDVVYFGTAAWDTTNSKHTGNLKRIKLESTLTSSNINTFVTADHPIVAAPLTALGGDNKRWVMVGTGRLHVSSDNDIAEQQFFFSAFETKESDNSYNYTDTISDPGNDFEDTTDIRIFADGTITNTSGGTVSIGGNTVDSLTDVKNEIAANKKGWFVRLELDGTNPSGRVTHQATLDPANRGFMAYTEYQPPGGVCELDGNSYLWELSFEAGISGQFAPLGHDTTTPQNSGEIASAPKLSIGKGQASKVVYHQGIGGNLIAITNLSTGAIEGTSIAVENPGYGRQSWQQIDLSDF
jgi:type IV pilus assembly protein PilY1